jgi:hypothetical protein
MCMLRTLTEKRSFGLPPTIFAGRGWTSICRCSPSETQPHFRWFLA